MSSQTTQLKYEDREAMRAEIFRFLFLNLPQYRNTLHPLGSNRSPSQVIVAGLDGESQEITAAAVGGHLNFQVTYCNFFYVLPKSRGSGLGKVLLNQFEAKAVEAGRSRLEFEAYEAVSALWLRKRGYTEREGRTDDKLLIKREGLVSLYKNLSGLDRTSVGSLDGFNVVSLS